MDIIPPEPHAKVTFLSNLILGGQDGLVNVLGVILGVGAASGETRIILAGGLAATFAESISMAAVAYTSKMAEKDHYEAEMIREKREIKEMPEMEKKEIRDIYKAKGFSGKLLDEIVTHITSNEQIWLSTMMAEELQLSPIYTKDVLQGSMVVGISAVIGSIIPLFPFFFVSVNQGIILSIIFSGLALFIVGAYKSQVTVGKPLRGGAEMLVIGIGAAIIGYAIGIIFQSR